MCFTGGVGCQDETELRLSYSMDHMDAIHSTHSSLKQSISLNDFGLTGLGHTHTPAFLLYSMTGVCFLAQVLPQDI